MGFREFIRNWFFKKRLLFRNIGTPDSPPKKLPGHFNFLLFEKPDDVGDPLLKKRLFEFCLDRYGKKEAHELLNNPLWKGFAVYDSKTRGIAGTAWLLCSPDNDYWYDNVKFSKSEAHLAKLYVHPAFRGNQIGSFLKQKRLAYAKEKNFSSVAAIVESGRKTALQIQEGFAAETEKSFLIKLFKVNIFSVLVNSTTRIWYVGPGRNRLFRIIKSKSGQ